MTVLHPRLRQLVPAAEWARIVQRKCPAGARVDPCQQPPDPRSRYGYCTSHDHSARAQLGDDYFAD
ncbi:hypothetical protein [Dactylosporangium salmoneum]|uniref:Uncharacterized protein n=1 Tax=Dactylosporangium salmoneum TaxID=53361 RepID=A0ABN3GAA1_9ACTN